MKSKRLLALLLSFIIMAVTPFAAFAADEGASEEAWAPDDFTYGPYEKLLYGCDYSRQFTVKGIAITGFSEKGLAKLESNTDLVIPSKDTEGNTICGIGKGAFRDKGLTSVVFPTGMMVPYDDQVTGTVTRRGNFVIDEDAFAKNKLTEVYLPSGVIACLSNSFLLNEIEKVTFPRTIWWIETQSFARNNITEVKMPKTTDFSLEIHGQAFAANKIKSVRLPDFTEVVNKETFDWNPGMEPFLPGTPDKYNAFGDEYVNSGIVYMYTSNPDLANKDRIHHVERETASQHSYVQRLVINEGDSGESDDWNVNDFTYEGTTVTGLSESGIEKRATSKRLVIPDRNEAGVYVTAIADASPVIGGLFATSEEKFETVELPSKLEVIGANAFRDAGVKDIQFPNTLKRIGTSAFLSNSLTSVVLPDSVTELSDGAFATNTELENISLSRNLKVIPTSAFGCSDAKHYMTKLTSIEIPEGVTSIGTRAFAGNNFHSIEIPASVKTIGSYAFSTKNYLKEPCALTLHEGLETIGDYAFRNKCIEAVQLPKSLKSFKSKVFLKEYSDGQTPSVTDVYVPTSVQYDDRTNFPENNSYHKLYLLDSGAWESSDFEYKVHEDDGTASLTGLSEQGEMKARLNKSLELPSNYESGDDVYTIARIEDSAFEGLGLKEVELPKSLQVISDKAFAANKIKVVQLPVTIEEVSGSAFASNVDSSGKAMTVEMYLSKAVQAPVGIQVNSGQKLVRGIYGEVPTSWTQDDFTYDEASASITGWSDSGQDKRNKLHELVLPDQTPGGKDIVSVSESAFEIPEAEIVVTKFGIDSPNGMTSVKLPKNLRTIGRRAFACNALTNVDLTGIVTIDESAFYGNKLKAAILPDTVTNLGNGAFANNNITEIRLSRNVTVIPTGAFSMNIRLEKVEIPDTVTEIGQTAFAGARLTELKIPKSVTKIGTKAFHLHHLTSLVIPGNVKVIGESAFEGTYKATTLKSLVIEDGVETIGKYAFKEALLEEVRFPESIKTVGAEPFLNNKGKDGSHVVEVKSSNPTHLAFKDSTYAIKYVKTATRIYGTSRYDTGLAAADKFKSLSGEAKLQNVVVASGENYPDALTGSYLAKVKSAPVLLVSRTSETRITSYIKQNLASGGTVYILGGEGAVSKAFARDLESKGIKVERLGGTTRFDTNLAILKAADVSDEELLLCTGSNYADSLSASAAGRPIMLVGSSLTSAQKEYLESLDTKKAYAIGGKSVVSDKIVSDFKDVTGVDAVRIAGTTRYDTSVEVAKTFFAGNLGGFVVLVYGQNYPDGLSGAPVAMTLDAPIILASNQNYKACENYCKSVKAVKAYVLGGPMLISDAVALKMMH